MEMLYDYIIIGAGSSGCVIAEQLSRDTELNILVLEAGPVDNNPFIAMPKGVAKLVTNPKHIWAYQVTQPRIAGDAAKEIWIRGKGLGGSSAINGMIWSRGSSEDYDDWERLGADGWNSRAMVSALNALEDHGLGASERRGVGGPVHIDPKAFSYPLADKMCEAGAQMGYATTDDLNAVSGPRVGYYQHNIRKGKRESAAKTFLRKAMKRKNVHVKTGVTAERIIFDGLRAVAVEANHNGANVSFALSGEVIISTGALESPLLLQRSGIGPAEKLNSAGVELLVDSPNVGKRIREHLSFSMPFRLKKDVGTSKQLRGIGLILSTLKYYFTGKGIMATGPFEIGAFASVGPYPSRIDTQLYLGGYTFALSDDNHPVPLDRIDDKPGLTIYGSLLRLSSEGDIAISGPDSASSPEINPNWLSNTDDCKSAINLIRLMRTYAAQPALADYIAGELMPGEDISSDEDILDCFRRNAQCGLHATGSCAMGSTADSVLDSRLKVRGVENVRVADCSAMPVPISGNTNAPAMALGLIAAQIIIEDRN